MAALEFKLPDIGEGIAEGEIVKWLVKAGEAVKEHQPVVEVMTDKATVEVPSPASGTIRSLNAKEGQTVPVGSVIFVLETAAGAQAPPAPAHSGGHAAPAAASASKPAPAAPLPSASSAAAPAKPAAAPAAGGRMLEFKLPDIGEGIAEGEIVKWLVQAGAAVKEHQAVVEVMTDKATVEVPSPASGTITALLAKEGETVPVGKVIFTLAVAGGVAAPAAAPSHALPAVAAASHAPAAPALVGATSAPARVSAADSKILAVPSARRVARDLGIDLARVPASGRGGVVRRADVEAFARSAASSAPIAAPAHAAPAAPARPTAPAVAIPAGERETRVPFRGVRRKISEAMVRSKYTAPHFTVVEELDVTELVRLRETAKALGQEQGVKVTYMPFIMKATALALAKFPMLNAHLDEQSQEIVRYGYVNLGIAMDTDNGLIVPVVKDVGSKGILQIATELNELAERTKQGKVKPDDLRGSTFSITNAGNIGGILATPIINFPDVAILGVHRLMKRPGVVETPQGDKIEVRQYMNLSCSVDHRLADGADGARFLVLMKRLLENPGLLAL
ncbi:MAG: 2-oxo acid dehydrogenase subunit E2 [Planctomycetes bacterium]|nr:2-oxo acid dehydrogenase subunit E2 [Planctomycetota bacterium]